MKSVKQSSEILWIMKKSHSRTRLCRFRRNSSRLNSIVHTLFPMMLKRNTRQLHYLVKLFNKQVIKSNLSMQGRHFSVMKSLTGMIWKPFLKSSSLIISYGRLFLISQITMKNGQWEVS